MTTWAQQILTFQKNLSIATRLPAGVEVLNPYRHAEALHLCKIFYTTFYNDTQSRTMILGINPGRLGGGLTGIPFTDPLQLDQLGFSNSYAKKSELSASFIYRMIDAFGGPHLFYQKFYITSVSPLGFIRQGKNLNYYDVPALAKKLHTFIVDCLYRQLQWKVNRKIAFCIGEGENFKFLKKLNAENNFFEEIIPLAHPRFIMQYRLKKADEFISRYIELLGQAN